MLFPPDPVPPRLHVVLFSPTCPAILPYHWKIAIQRSRLALTSFQAFRASCSSVQSRVQTDYHHSSGKRLQVASPSHSNMWVAVIRAVNKFWSSSPPSFSSFALAFLCTPSVIQKEPRSRQTRHTHIHTHQITAYDWSQALCLSSLEAMTFQFLARLCLFSSFKMFQAPWILIYFNPHWFQFKTCQPVIVIHNVSASCHWLWLLFPGRESVFLDKSYFLPN